MPAGTPLDADVILAATEEVLRRHGPAKATVVDVARALGVSHTAVYQHFPSKQALREAVTRRWLSRDRDTLAVVAADAGTPPPRRLRAWLAAMLAAKQAKARKDPELFAAYGIPAAEHSSIPAEHVADLLGQLRAIIAAGDADGTFARTDPAGASPERCYSCRAVLPLQRTSGTRPAWRGTGRASGLQARARTATAARPLPLTPARRHSRCGGERFVGHEWRRAGTQPRCSCPYTGVHGQGRGPRWPRRHETRRLASSARRGLSAACCAA